MLKHVYCFLGTRLILLTFAISIVYTGVCLVNRTSFAILDASGLFCSPVTFRVEEEQGDGPWIVHQRLDRFCSAVNLQLWQRAYEIVIDYWDDNRFLYPASLRLMLLNRFVPTSLRRTHQPPIFAIPFRRKINAPWHVMIARTGQFGSQEYVLSERSTTITMGRTDQLFLYVNEPVVGLPIFYNWFYRGIQGTAEITISKKP